MDSITAIPTSTRHRSSRGIALCVLVLGTSFLCQPSAAEQVPRWETLDVGLTGGRDYANAFRDVRVSAFLRSPSGRTLEVRGVYNGSRNWLVRLSFDELGEWQVETRSVPSDPQLASRRTVRVTPPTSGGPVRLSLQEGGFVQADGTPLFHAGDTSYPLLGLDREKQLLPYLRLRAAQGFSHIRFQAAVVDPRFPDLWPWGGTRSDPDPDRLNPEYFQRLDGLMRDLRAHGLKAEVILLNYYRDSGIMADKELWNADRERLWLTYVVSRYAAFDHVLYWTVANEYETYPDGRYGLGDDNDVAWARATAAFVKTMDPYRHPVTVHPFSPANSYGEAFGSAPEIDFLMVQDHGAKTQSTRFLAEGDGAGLEAKIQALRSTGKVIVAGEFGYEWDGSTERGFNVTTDLLRRHAWRVVMGGGHFSAGFRSTVYNFREITFDITNGGRPGAEYISRLIKFFRDETRFHRLEPRPELTAAGNLCLKGDNEYVIYAPHGGNVQLDLSRDNQAFAAVWFNPLTGERKPEREIAGGGVFTFESPWEESVLHLASRVSVRAPRDGGWPRDPSAIVRNGPADFTVHPLGHDRYIFVEVENRSSRPEQVTLRGFITDFGRMRDKTVSGSQYLYLKPPGGPWQRLYRDGESLQFSFSPLRFTALPGNTRVATVVNFTHEEYARYVESLNDPRITKDIVLSSAAGKFKAHRIRITRPGGGPKLRIALARATHAYEHSGFYMAQGVIEWLLSGDPAANLDAIEWTVYPCLDPQAIHDGRNYNEYDNLRLDDGRTQSEAVWNPKTGEIPLEKYHVLTTVHMWEFRNFESYKYNDPYAPAGPAGNGKSSVESVMLGFWPFWFEFGIDEYDHENKWGARNTRPEDFGGALVTHLEIPFYGKDDVDPRQRLREQGRKWARSHSQAFLALQRERSHWNAGSAAGGFSLDGAVFLPVPTTALIENLRPEAGIAHPRRNAAGGPMTLYHEVFERGIGMRAGGSVTYRVPGCANTFRAMAGVDDAESSGEAVTFVALGGGKEVWRSRELRRTDREMAYFSVAGGMPIELRVLGSANQLANWGGATFTCDDPDRPDLVSGK